MKATASARATAYAGSSPARLLPSLRAAKDLSFGFAVLLLLVFASIGFLHKPLAGQAQLSVGRQEIDANGLVLCIGGGPDGKSGLSSGSLCDACLLTSAPGLLAKVEVTPTPLGPTLEVRQRQDANRLQALSIARATARGPPFA